jgi:hypothetical protein
MLSRPMAGGPGVLQKTKILQNRIAPNGRRPTTMRLASARRIVAEAERANASVAKPEEP